jgi:hypothetical protein
MLQKLSNEDIHDLYSLQNISSVISLRSLRATGYVACVGENRKVYRVLGVGELKHRDNLKDTDVDGDIILKRIFTG